MWTSVPLLKEGYNLLSSDVTINIDVSREYREMVDIDDTEYTDDINITTTPTSLSEFLTNYDRLYAYEITSITASDSIKVNDDWRQANNLEKCIMLIKLVEDHKALLYQLMFHIRK